MKKHNKPTPRDINYSSTRERTEVSTLSSSPYILPSASVIHKYGIPRSAALNMLHNYWVISKDYKQLFSIYYLLHWEAGYFRQAVKDGMLERKGVRYQVIYHRCYSYHIGKGAGELLLSFRCLVSDYESTPTVLVTIA